MAVGFPTKANWAAGDILTAAQMDDLAGTLNTVQTPLGNAAGKNVALNGAFNVWQRGTSFTPNGAYTADRYLFYRDGAGATLTVSQQALTPGSISGYDSPYFLRAAQSVAGTGGTYNVFSNRIENVQTLAGQSVTISFWAKADATRTLGTNFIQNFGTGGSSATYTAGTTMSLTTSWVRYSTTVTAPSISGKTVGTGSYVDIRFDMPVNSTFTIDIWGVQVEAGSTATNFQTATGTLQGELAACQRYYYRWVTNGVSTAWAGTGMVYNTTTALIYMRLPITMRTNPGNLETSGTASDYRVLNPAGGTGCSAVPVIDTSHYETPLVKFTTAGSLTAGYACSAGASTTNNAYLGFNAEL
jgi:hypothetical protein